MTRAALSVVIPTRNRPDRLKRVIASLLADLATGDELIVVDSASSDSAAVAAEVFIATQSRFDIDIRLIRAPRPGSSLARNLGWRSAGQRLVAFVDDDVEVLPGWSSAIVAGLDRPGVGFLTAWIGVPPEQAGIPDPNPLMVNPRAFMIDRNTHGLLGASANFAAKVDALQRVSGFDERLGPGCRIPAAEDHNLLDRLLTANVVGAYEPAAQVQHEQWRTRRDNFKLHWRMGVGAGARLSRLLRHDPRRLGFVSHELIVDDILRALVNSLRAGYRTGFVLASLRLLGLMYGFIVAPYLA